MTQTLHNWNARDGIVELTCGRVEYKVSISLMTGDERTIGEASGRTVQIQRLGALHRSEMLRLT